MPRMSDEEVIAAAQFIVNKDRAKRSISEDKLWQFVYLVAGATNTTVDRYTRSTTAGSGASPRGPGGSALIGGGGAGPFGQISPAARVAPPARQAVGIGIQSGTRPRATSAPGRPGGQPPIFSRAQRVQRQVTPQLPSTTNVALRRL